MIYVQSGVVICERQRSFQLGVVRKVPIDIYFFAFLFSARMEKLSKITFLANLEIKFILFKFHLIKTIKCKKKLQI